MSNSKKTLYLCPNGYLGGAEKAMIHFCYGHQINHWPAEILFFQNGPAVDYAKEYGITCHVLPIKFRLSNIIKLVKATLFIRHFIRKHHFKIIHATMAYSQIVSFLSSCLLPVTRVWYQHGPVGGTLDKLASLTSVDQIYFNTTFLQQVHNNSILLPTDKEKQFVIPYGIENKVASIQNIQLIKQTYSQRQTPLFLLAGRICSWKGYEIAIEALAQFIDMPWHLLIIGSAFRESDKRYENKLRHMVKSLDLEKRITFLSFQKNIYDYFAAADLFFHTSNVPEPFGLVVAEAMLQKTFVIGSSKGGVTDILKDGVTGLSFDSTSSQPSKQLIKKLQEYFTLSEQQRQQIVEHGHQLIEKRHNLKTSASTLERLYTQ